MNLRGLVEIAKEIIQLVQIVDVEKMEMAVLIVPEENQFMVKMILKPIVKKIICYIY